MHTPAQPREVMHSFRHRIPAPWRGAL